MAAALLAVAQDPSFLETGGQVRSEIERVRKLIKDKPITSPDFPNAGANVDGLLKSATDALDAGMLYLGVERLAQAVNFANGVRTAEDKADAVKSSLAAFQTEWNQASVNLTAVDRDLRARDWTRSPTVIRAMSESALTRTGPLMSGSMGFATSTQPRDGLYYMGQALGEAEFARFCATLKLSRKTRAVPVRSMLPELQALQEKTNAAFKPPRSIDLHPRFIALNATIKLASELDAARFYSGSLYQYLEALRRYVMLDTTLPEGEQRAALKKSLKDWTAKLEASKDDVSIAQLFVQRAERYVTHPDGSEPSNDEWIAAQVIVDQVLPAYFSARKAPLRTQRSNGKTIAITLVRWPYT
jgi:hypothetical protein